MRKTIAGVMAAATFAGAVLASSASEARDYGYYRHHHDNDGAAVAAGIAGLAIGAALASSSRDRYYDDGYRDRYYRGGYGYYEPPRHYYRGPRYYGPPRAYSYGYGGCRTYERYDPYYGGYIRRTNCW